MLICLLHWGLLLISLGAPREIVEKKLVGKAWSQGRQWATEMKADESAKEK